MTNKPVHTAAHQYLFDLAMVISNGEPHEVILQKFEVDHEAISITKERIVEAHRLFKEACHAERQVASRKKYYRWQGKVFSREMKRECFHIEPDQPIRKSEEIRALVRLIVYKQREEWAKEVQKIHDILHLEEDFPTSPMEPTPEDLEAIEKGLAKVDFDFDEEVEDDPEHETDPEDEDENNVSMGEHNASMGEESFEHQEPLHNVLHPDNAPIEDDSSSDFDLDDDDEMDVATNTDSGIAEKLDTDDTGSTSPNENNDNDTN